MKGVVLLVDDDAVSVQVLSAMLKKHKYGVVEVSNGAEALEYLAHARNHVDLVIMDYIMPVMDGLTFLKEYKRHDFFGTVPVIMVTGEGSVVTAEHAITSGVYNYLQKPVDEKILLSLVDQAIKNFRQYSVLCDIAAQQHDIKTMLREAFFSVKYIDNVRSLSQFVAGFYPEPKKAVVGVFEVILNAIEHGNLDIGFEEKQGFLLRGTWEEEVKKRQAMEPYQARCVKVCLCVAEKSIVLTVEDEGKGFDAQAFLNVEAREPKELNGRGILIAKHMSFDAIEYNDLGNKVTCTKKL